MNDSIRKLGKVTNVGSLKELLENVPDDYIFLAEGDSSELALWIDDNSAQVSVDREVFIDAEIERIKGRS